MSDTLFKKALCFTDIHVGLRQNSVEHNEDCISFIEWFISEGKSRGCDTCIFLGDFHHHRSNVNVLSLNYTMRILRMLNNAFSHSYFIVGNHDLFYREKRDIHSMVVGSEFPNITLINDIRVIKDVAFVPWLVESEWKNISSMESKYIFGHLELPGFKMNAMVEMPDNGTLNSGHFKNQSHVFSGHFHKRQTKGKVSYIGNPFGHNYSDAWDFDRGAMFIEWDKEPEFINYVEGPRFINTTLSTLLSNPPLYLKPKTYLQVTLDTNITYEEAMILRETFLNEYNVREFRLVHNLADISSNVGTNITVKSINQIVIEELPNVVSDRIDYKQLIDIYNRL